MPNDTEEMLISTNYRDIFKKSILMISNLYIIHLKKCTPFWYDSLREEQLGYGRNYDEASERHQHGHCPEGEVLLAALLVIERVMDDSRNPDIWLSS